MSDLALDSSDKSINDIVRTTQSWATGCIRENPMFEFGRDVIYIQERDACPYATIFVLFLCGQHQLAI